MKLRAATLFLAPLKWSAILLLLLIGRKIGIAFYSMSTVWQCMDQVDTERMLSSPSFSSTVSSLGNDSLVLILNRHALNMTLNWLCNTQAIPDVHSHSLIVTLDSDADAALAAAWPGVRRLHWSVPCLQNPFNYGDGCYQLFYLFRSNLALALLRSGKRFWMIQQDTYWHSSLHSLAASPVYQQHDILFDTASEGENALIAGGYYRASPTPRSIAYFSKLSADLWWWYAPDNTYMTYLCATMDVDCGRLPFSFITNWQWLVSPSSTPPHLIQFDGYRELGGKLATMRELGFYFLNDDARTCNASAVERASRIVHNPPPMTVKDSVKEFAAYQHLVDSLYAHPVSRRILERFLLPYAHYAMLTM